MSVNSTVDRTVSSSVAERSTPMNRRIVSAIARVFSSERTFPGNSAVSAPGIRDATYADRSRSLGWSEPATIRVGTFTEGRTSRTSVSYQISASDRATSGVHALRLAFAIDRAVAAGSRR